jgi:hypothetical protein
LKALGHCQRWRSVLLYHQTHHLLILQCYLALLGTAPGPCPTQPRLRLPVLPTSRVLPPRADCARQRRVAKGSAGLGALIAVENNCNRLTVCGAILLFLCLTVCKLPSIFDFLPDRVVSGQMLPPASTYGEWRQQRN